MKHPLSFQYLFLALLVLPACVQALDTDDLIPWLPTITPAELQQQMQLLPSPDRPDKQGYTLLHHSLCLAPWHVTALLDSGASPHSAPPEGGNSLHHLLRCHYAANGDEAILALQQLLAAGADPETRDNQGRTALLMALDSAREARAPERFFRESIYELLASGANLSARDNQGRTAVHFVAAGSMDDLTEHFLEQGLPSEQTDEQGRTPLEHAARAGQLRQIRLLLSWGADANQSSDGRQTLLPVAIASGRLPLLQTLMQATDQHVRKSPSLILEYLQLGGQSPVILEWLILQGYSLDVRDELGNTPLLRAASEGKEDLAQIMIKHGASTRATNNSGCDIHCYLREGIAGYNEKTRLPTLENHPAGFFVLAFAPAILLYLLVTGLGLKRDQSLLAITLRASGALASGMLITAALFFRCDPCLAESDKQLYISAVLTFFITLIVLFPFLKSPPGKSDDNVN